MMDSQQHLDSVGEAEEGSVTTTSTHTSTSTRIMKGSRAEIQEYIDALVKRDCHEVEVIAALPVRVKGGEGKGKGKMAEGEKREGWEEEDHDEGDVEPLVSPDCWIYEQLRRLALDLTYPWIVQLQKVCTKETCPEMRADQWLYICAAHATISDSDCPAISYSIHTLDGATALLSSPRYFPSRIHIPTSSLKHFTSIARRLYRIFAHSWFHHKTVFEECEAETSLYKRFLALTANFDLVDADLLVIPFNTGNREDEEEEGEFGDEGEKQGEGGGQVEGEGR